MNVMIVGEKEKSEIIIKNLKNYGAEISFVNLEKDDEVDVKKLEESRIEFADLFIASTDKDKKNLFLCQVAKKIYKVGKTIAVVNNPNNMEFMRNEGIDFTISVNLFLINSIKHCMKAIES